MGLGKTFTGAEKLNQLGAKINLVICQKSKIDDWIEHFKKYYEVITYNLTNKNEFEVYSNYNYLLKHEYPVPYQIIGIINYDLAFRRKDLLDLENFTLMLDESSMIQNEDAKRTKFILKLNPENVIPLES